MRKLAENWIAYAYADLRAAEKLEGDHELSGIATFHCQQCVEKSLKAMLALHCTQIPRIHDLVTLHKRVTEVEPPPMDVSELLQLNDAYIDVRYPIDPSASARTTPSPQKTREFVALATRVYEFCRSKFD